MASVDNVCQYIKDYKQQSKLLLDAVERQHVQMILQQFVVDRCFNHVTEALPVVLNTPEKRKLYPLIKNMIPTDYHQKYQVFLDAGTPNVHPFQTIEKLLEIQKSRKVLAYENVMLPGKTSVSYENVQLAALQLDEKFLAVETKTHEVQFDSATYMNAPTALPIPAASVSYDTPARVAPLPHYNTPIVNVSKRSGKGPDYKTSGKAPEDMWDSAQYMCGAINRLDAEKMLQEASIYGDFSCSKKGLFLVRDGSKAGNFVLSVVGDKEVIFHIVLERKPPSKFLHVNDTPFFDCDSPVTCINKMRELGAGFQFEVLHPLVH